MTTKRRITSASTFNRSHSLTEGTCFGSHSAVNIDLRSSPDF